VFSKMTRPALGPTQHPTQRVTGALAPGGKAVASYVDYRPPSNAEVQNEWSCTSIPP